MRLAFEKSGPAGLSGWAIDLFTGLGGASHVETVFDGGVTISAQAPEGVTEIHERIYTPDKWRVYDLANSWADFTVVNVGRREVGCPYDYRDLFHHLPFLWWVKESPKAWICSELAVYLCQQAGLFMDLTPFKVTPNGLEKAVRKAGFKQVV
jgi:hypothetical protein